MNLRIQWIFGFSRKQLYNFNAEDFRDQENHVAWVNQKMHSQFCHTLQLLLGLPELLQLREIFVQYKDFGEAEGSHFRRLGLDLVQNFPYRNFPLDSISRMFLRIWHLENISVFSLLCVLGALVTALAHFPPQISRKRKEKQQRNTQAYIIPHRGKLNKLHKLRPMNWEDRFYPSSSWISREHAAHCTFNVVG